MTVSLNGKALINKKKLESKYTKPFFKIRIDTVNQDLEQRCEKAQACTGLFDNKTYLQIKAKPQKTVAHFHRSLNKKYQKQIALKVKAVTWILF